MLIEQNTNYAYKLKYMGNPTFDKVRDLSTKFYRELPQALQDELHEALNRGIDILDSEPQMTAYLFSFGKMHQAKLEYAFNHLPEEFLSQPEINIIDYGCGQALGTMCYADFLRDGGYAQKVKTVTLIEPSECCLKRAALHTSVFFPNAEIRTIHKSFDELCKGDICCDEYIPTLHILSNVLDMLNFDLEHFSNLVKQSLEGYNQFVCVGPCFFAFERDRRMDVLFERVGGNECFSETLDQYKLNSNKAWTCKVKIFSANIFVRNIDNNTKELSYSDHGADIAGIFSSSEKNVTCAAFSPDEKKLFSISDDGVIIIRNLHLQELQKDCSTAKNNILQAYAEAFEKTDASIVEPFLKEDFHYSSVYVFEEIDSKQEYLDYLSDKFKAIRRTRAFVTVYVVHDKPNLLLLMQDGNEPAVLHVEIENGLIARADMMPPSLYDIDISKYIPLPDLDIVPDCIDIARKVLSLVESKHYDDIYIPLNGISLPEGCILNVDLDVDKWRPDGEYFVDDDMFLYRCSKSEYMITKKISEFYVTTKDGKKDPDIYKYIEVPDTTLGAWQVYLLDMIWHFFPIVQYVINGKRSIVLDTRDLQNAIDTLNNKYSLHISADVSEYNVRPRVVKRDNDYLVYCCYWPHFWSELIDATGPETQSLHWSDHSDTYMAEWKGPVREVVRIVIENNKVKEVYDLSRKELFKIPLSHNNCADSINHRHNPTSFSIYK